jgi:hypothetical protein
LIFLDGDVIAAPLSSAPEGGINTSASAWRMFEEFLLKYEPAVGVPDYRIYEPGGVHSC